MNNEPRSTPPTADHRPRAGTSIALDLKIGDGTRELVARLNRDLLREGGRIYLAKDLFTRREDFEAMEPRLERWREVRRKYDPERRISSRQGERLLDD